MPHSDDEQVREANNDDITHKSGNKRSCKALPADEHMEKGWSVCTDRIISPAIMDADSSLSRSDTGVEQYPIGVVIPTYNRAEMLLSCLRYLEQQTWNDFEVVVVDDGSTDLTASVVRTYQRTSPLHLRYLSQPNAGPGRARNYGISILQAPVCLLIGDDILATPGLVETHLKLHLQRPEVEAAGLGLTRWSESDQKVTRFMRWLDEGGMQFSYGPLLRGETPDWRHFYTSNLSVKTKLLRENSFDESFRGAAMEDMELGYRLERRCGLKTFFLEEALALHVHPTSFRQACRRMLNVGRSTRRFQELWPEVGRSRPSPGKRLLHALVTCTTFLPIITYLADALTRLWCPNPVMRCALLSWYLKGYRRGAAQEQAGPSAASQPAK